MTIENERAVSESQEAEDARPNIREAPALDGELSDDDLDGVAGGANFTLPTPKPLVDIG